MVRTIAEALYYVAWPENSINNFEIDKRAKELADTTTHYELARKVAMRE